MRNQSGLLLLTLLLGACSTAIPSDNPPEPQIEETTETNETVGEEFEYESYVTDDGSWDIMVYWNNEKLATLNKEKPGDGYSVELLEKTDSNLYVGINYTGLGGYILYGGAHSVYRINLETKNVQTLWESDDSDISFVTDIAPDENSMLVFFSNKIGETSIAVVDINEDYPDRASFGNAEATYGVPEEFDEAGEGKFSPDGKSFAYAASIKGDEEEVTALWVINLETREEKEVSREKGTGEVVWQDNETVVLD